VANIVVWPKVMTQFRKVVMQSRLLMVEGYVQRDVEIIHVIAQNLEDRTDALLRLAPDSPLRDGSPLKVRPGATAMHPRNVKIIPNSRDFH